MAIAMTDSNDEVERLRDLQSVLKDVFADKDHLRAELLVTQQLNAELLEALQAVAEADTLEAAQEIACAAVAIAIARGTTDD